jgi:hypothetical protein
MDSFKRSTDWSKGMTDRQFVASNLNKYLSEYNLKLEWDKSEFGAAFCIHSIEAKSKKIPIYIRFSNDFGFFIKLPTSYIHNPMEYYDLIKHHLVLYVKRDIKIHDEYANILTIEYIKFQSHWKVLDSKGNKNRLQFDFKIDSLVYNSPLENSFFEPNIINQIKNIYNQK